MAKVIFINREEVLNERQALLKEAAKWMAKIVSLNSLYNGRILKIQRKIEKLDRIIGE